MAATVAVRSPIPEDQLLGHLPARRRHRRDIDACQYALATLRRRHMTLKGRAARRGWVHCSSEYLDGLFGQPFRREILPALLDEGLLVRSPTYIPDRQAFGYRPSDDLQLAAPVPVVISDPRQLARIEEARRRFDENATPASRHLVQCLKRVSIDAPAATAALERAIDLRSLATVSDDAASTYDPAAALALGRELISDIARGEWGLPRCNQFGRFHSCVTSLKREARPHLLIDGEPTVELDIAGCQPLLLGLTARDEIGTPPDVLDYLETCRAGRLYVELMQAIGWTRGAEAFKADVWFMFFFGKTLPQCVLQLPQFHALARVQLAFASRWPLLTRWLFRRRQGTNWKRVSTDCQRLEANLIIHRGAVESLRVSHPEIAITTVHDSIICLPRHADVVEAAIVEAFGRYDIQPTIRRKGLT